MQYLGGKSRIAKEIAAVVAPRGLWWEPFCGGLSVSVQLAKYGPGIVSDANPALIALYQAVRDGWVPPEHVSEDEYRAARSLPDTDPRKAFIGFGCSFGGKWFGGYARNATATNYASQGRRALLRDIPRLNACRIVHTSFFDVDPWSSTAPECIYADPPYAGTTGYAAAGAFDHQRFWSTCQAWASRGVRVFVSEYACPVGAETVWEKRHSTTVGRGKARAASTSDKARTERLFRVHPPTPAQSAA